MSTKIYTGAVANITTIKELNKLYRDINSLIQTHTSKKFFEITSTAIRDFVEELIVSKGNVKEAYHSLPLGLVEHLTKEEREKDIERLAAHDSIYAICQHIHGRTYKTYRDFERRTKEMPFLHNISGSVNFFILEDKVLLFVNDDELFQKVIKLDGVEEYSFYDNTDFHESDEEYDRREEDWKKAFQDNNGGSSTWVPESSSLTMKKTIFDITEIEPWYNPDTYRKYLGELFSPNRLKKLARKNIISDCIHNTVTAKNLYDHNAGISAYMRIDRHYRNIVDDLYENEINNLALSYEKVMSDLLDELTINVKD